MIFDSVLSRLKNAVNALRGKPIQSLTLGLDIKRCNQCEYKSDYSIREHLLVITGARAAYMDSAGTIDIPGGFEEEGKLAWFVKKIVDGYIQETTDVCFDEYIETALFKQYGKEN